MPSGNGSPEPTGAPGAGARRAPGARYDQIGRGYAEHRRPDPRIGRQISRALGDAARVVNVGAGTGSYEPDAAVVAVEPSAAMTAQRPPGGARAVRAVAEGLPFADLSFDAALAVITVHHWSDPTAGLGELARVAPRQVVLTFDPERHADYWLFTEYLPAALPLARRGVGASDVAAALGRAGSNTVSIEPVLVPADCTDGFTWAYWRRPERYFDPGVRAAISSLALLPETALSPGLERLAADLGSGRWHERHADLLALDRIDGGFRLVVAG